MVAAAAASSCATLLRYVLPLALVNIIKDGSEQVVDAGIARDPDARNAERVLAAFGICWYMCILVSGVVGTVQQVALVLGKTATGRRSVLTVYAGVCSFACSGFAFVGLYGPASRWVFEELHGLSGDTLHTAQLMISALSVFPLVYGCKKYYSGILSANKTTFWISCGAMLNVGTVFGVVIALKLLRPTSWVGWEPVLALYTSEVVDCSVVATAARRLQRQKSKQYEPVGIPTATTGSGKSSNGGAAGSSVWGVVRFAWPLALRETTMGISRPFINLWVARTTAATAARLATSGMHAETAAAGAALDDSSGDPAAAAAAAELAVLIVVYPFIHVSYGWLNELRSIAAAYADDPVVTAWLRTFYYLAMSFSLFCCYVLAWSPLSEWLLLNVTGITPELFQRCVIPLRLFTAWPPAVALRSYTQGQALKLRRTERLAPAGPLRVLAIFSTLQCISVLGECSARSTALHSIAPLGPSPRHAAHT